MKMRFWMSLTGFAVAMLILLLFPVPSLAQTATSSPDIGNPNFSGVWTNPEAFGTCDNENIYTRCGREIFEGKSLPVKSRVVDPPDGKIPYLPWARAQQQEHAKNFMAPPRDYVDLQSRCLPSGPPRLFIRDHLQFIQIPGYVVILVESLHAYRVIPLDGRPHVAKDVPLWMGDSRGHWEGETLVVDVTNLDRRMWFDVMGNFHSGALHMVERFKVADPDTIQYEATFEDPNVYSRPWKMAMTFKRDKSKGSDEFLEWACWESEPDLRKPVSGDSAQR